MKRPVRTISTDVCRVYEWFYSHNDGEATPEEVFDRFGPDLGGERIKRALRRLVTIGMLFNYTKRGPQGVRGLYLTLVDADDPAHPLQQALHHYMLREAMMIRGSVTMTVAELREAVAKGGGR